MAYLSAGFISNSLKPEPQAAEVFKKLCVFEVDSPVIKNPASIKVTDQTAVFAVLNNIITRGFPTWGSYYLEEKLRERTSGYILEETDFGEIKSHYPRLNSHRMFEDYKILPENFPDRQLRDYQRKKAESDFEYSLISKLENKVGTWVSAVLCQQVPLDELFGEANPFKGQRVDYLLPFPHPIDGIKGIIIEMDGPQHAGFSAKYLDFLRDKKSLEYGYRSLRISSRDSSFTHILQIKELVEFLSHSCFNPFRGHSGQSEEAQNAVITLPLLIARVQLSIVRAVLSNPAWADEPQLRVAIIERDVNGADLAVEDLNHWLGHFKNIADDLKLPEIRCEVFRSQGSISRAEAYHFVLDVSVQSRFADIGGCSFPNRIVVRNAPLYKDPKRQVLTGPHIPYQSFGLYENQKWVEEEENEAAVSSLRWMLKSLFRKKDFRDGQLPIINRALQGLSVIGLLPTGGGKSLSYQFAGLLQPGVCLIVDPIVSLMLDQVAGLKKHLIDSCDSINYTAKDYKEREEIQKRVQEGRVQFFFISPERMQIQAFRDYLQNMAQGTPAVTFSYCVIDEAHCVSEWGHDFRTSYLSVAENALLFCKTASAQISRVPLVALTATASYDVLTDIQRELSGNSMDYHLGEDSIIEPESHLREELLFVIIPIQPVFSDNDDIFELRDSLANEKKTVVQELFYNHESVFDQGAALIFVPHRSGYFGIEDTITDFGVKEGWLNGIQARVPELAEHVTYFMSASGQNDEVKDEVIQNQNDFIENRKKIMVATKAFGMGIDKRNIRFTVHVNYPNSIESFLQEAGRAGRDRDNAICYLLYSQNEPFSNIEYDVNQYFHSLSFRGADKEKAILEELLFKIVLPTQLTELTTKFQDKFAEELYLSVWTSNTGNRYLNLSESFEKQVGNIMIEGKLPVYLHTNVENGIGICTAVQAREYLEFIKSCITQKGNADHIWKWIKSSSGEIIGIIPTLAGIKTGNEAVIQLPWVNNIDERVSFITRYVTETLIRKRKPSDTNYIAAKVRKAVESTINFTGFVESINKSFSRGTFVFDLEKFSFEDDQKKGIDKGTRLNRLHFYFNQARTKSDTEKALYRLRLLGVISDYTVDYRTQTFELKLVKNIKAYYQNRLKYYLSKFMADERVKKELRKAEAMEGEHYLQKYLNYLVDFGYKNIAEKRIRSIGEMKEACIYGLSNPGEKLQEYLALYLNSKYARDIYEVNGRNESLKHNLDNGSIDDLEWVWYYIKLMETDGNSEPNNLKHLRGACARMLNDSPTNPVLLILKSYATFFLEYENQELLKSSESDLARAFDEIAERFGFDEEYIEELFNKLVAIIHAKRPAIREYYTFEFENFRYASYLSVLKNGNEILEILNQKLYQDV